MAQDLAHPMHNTAPPPAPKPQTRAAADLLGVYRSRLRVEPGEVRSSITEADRPKGRDLALLVERADELRSFPPASQQVRERMISRLFLRFPNMASFATPEQVASYAIDLAAFPAWAISAGLGDIVSGIALKALDKPPSSPQVRAAVEARCKPFRAELAAISGLLEACERPIADAPPEVAAERRKAAADAARAAMRAGAPEEPVPRPRNPRLPSRFDAAHAPQPDRPLTLSDEALATCGRTRPMQAEDAA